MHTHTKTLLQKNAAAGCATSGVRDEKERVGTPTGQSILPYSNSPLSVGWSSMDRGGRLAHETVMTCNPIENLWAILDERLEDKKFKTEKGMKEKIRQLWDELDSSLLHNLIDSIPDRLRRIRKAKGGSIKGIK